MKKDIIILLFFIAYGIQSQTILNSPISNSNSWESINIDNSNKKDWNNSSLKLNKQFRTIAQIVSQKNNNNKCSFIINTHTSSKTIDGRKLPYSNIQPGDTICLESGQREALKIKNIKGTSDKPIVFINDGGLVDISTESGQALTFQNCQYFRLTGTGDSNFKYGIKISKSSDKGIRQERKSNNSEIDHVEFANIGTFGSNSKGIAYAPNVKSTCPDGFNAGYDYNNDGIEDIQDIVSPENFAMENILFHDNYLHNIAHEGLYLGVSFYHETTELKCKNGESFQVYDPEVKHVEVYNNIIESTGWEPIQVASATSGGCFIHHNLIKNGSLEEHPSGQSAGIKVKPGSKCDVYNNLIVDDRGPGIYYYKASGKVYNNVIVRPGIKAKEEWGQSGIVFYDSLPSNRSNIEKVYAFNNTIIKPRKYGIQLSKIAKLKDSIRLYNNIIVDPQKSKFIDFGSGYSVNSTHHNLETNAILGVGFKNIEEDNYELLATSIAVDSGFDLTEFGILEDFKDNLRKNQGISYDIGAFEFLKNTLSIDKITNSISIKVYPNPATKKVHVQLKNGVELQQIQLYNSLGSIVISSTKSPIDVSNLPKEIYFLNITTSKGKTVKKIIITD